LNNPAGVGEVPFEDFSSSSALRARGTNFSENAKGGGGLEYLTPSEMESEGFKVVKSVVNAFMRSWSQLSFNAGEIESEAMWWLATHQDQLMSSKSSSAFTAYAYKSLYKKLARFAQDLILDNAKNLRFDELPEEVEGGWGNDLVFVGMTIESVEDHLIAGRKEVLKMVEESCTKLQAETILKRYQDKKKIKDIAEEEGKTRAAVHDLIKQGIKNIALKGYI
jgi:hypothetical protein